jgi:apolipoprotein N-acyltransferase
VAVLLAGVAVGLSWQPNDLWPLMLVGIPAFTLAIRGTRPLAATGLGYVFGLAMLTIAVSWVHVLGTWVAAALIIGSVALIITAQQLRARVEPALSAALEPAD